jgi:hypothetical protein
MEVVNLYHKHADKPQVALKLQLRAHKRILECLLQARNQVKLVAKYILIQILQDLGLIYQTFSLMEELLFIQRPLIFHLYKIAPQLVDRLMLTIQISYQLQTIQLVLQLEVNVKITYY